MSATLRRRLILFVALLLTLWAVWDVSQPDAAELKRVDSLASSSKKTASSRQAPVASNFPGNLRFPVRQEDASPVRDLFAIPQAPAPSTVASASVAPVAPPLPYAYLGRFEDGGKKQIFLANGSHALAVVAGATLADGWKLESVESGRLTFVYVPLGQKQSLEIREY